MLSMILKMYVQRLQMFRVLSEADRVFVEKTPPSRRVLWKGFSYLPQFAEEITTIHTGGFALCPARCRQFQQAPSHQRGLSPSCAG